MVRSSDIAVWLKDLDREDTIFVGSKSANLGELIQSGFPVPQGFALTTRAYTLFLRENNLEKQISHLLNTINYNDPNSIKQVSSHIKKLINLGNFPKEVSNTIFIYYQTLEKSNSSPQVAVRSSSTSKNFSDADLGFMQETFLNVRGDTTLLLKIREAWASIFEAKAIYYRHQNKLDHLKIKNALTIQKMVESECSGVLFTIDPVINDKNTIIIEAIYGLGEYLADGKVDPDHYKVDKKELKIVEKRVSRQDVMMVKARYLSKEVKVKRTLKEKQKISNSDILKLAEYAKKLDKHYFFPQNCEWAKEKGKLYIVETKPVTTVNSQPKSYDNTSSTNQLSQYRTKPVLIGDPASPGIGIGPVRILKNTRDLSKIKHGDVVVVENTNPQLIPALRKASAIISEKGGRDSHTAVISRELGIPAVVGAPNALKMLKNNAIVTVNGRSGEVLLGSLKLSVPTSTLGTSKLKIKTDLLVNIDNPDTAEKYSTLSINGVGLLKAEDMISDFGIHPKKLIHDRQTSAYVDMLAKGIGLACKAFYPQPVYYRFSDFKTSEYRKLKSGSIYEPQEPNPMMGYRGAYRHINDPRVFELELKAIKKVREKMKLNNLNVMIPYVRTVKDLETIKSTIYKFGLRRSNTFKVFMMCELPSNVILIEDFIKVGIDGVSIGSDDLTTLVLGIDSENEDMEIEFDERNPAVLWSLERVIKKCVKNKIPVSVCGKAPSKYPDLVEKFVEWGVNSISVSPGAVDITREYIHKAENRNK